MRRHGNSTVALRTLGSVRFYPLLYGIILCLQIKANHIKAVFKIGKVSQHSHGATGQHNTPKKRLAEPARVRVVYFFWDLQFSFREFLEVVYKI